MRDVESLSRLLRSHMPPSGEEYLGAPCRNTIPTIHVERTLQSHVHTHPLLVSRVQSLIWACGFHSSLYPDLPLRLLLRLSIMWVCLLPWHNCVPTVSKHGLPSCPIQYCTVVDLSLCTVPSEPDAHAGTSSPLQSNVGPRDDAITMLMMTYM